MKVDIADVFIPLGIEMCGAFHAAQKGNHSGQFLDCPTERCKKAREAIEALSDWELCPGQHRLRKDKWERLRA